VIAPITVIAIPVTIVTVIRPVTRRMGTSVVAPLTVVEVESSVTAMKYALLRRPVLVPVEEAETGIFVSANSTPIVMTARFVVHRIAPRMVRLMGGASLKSQVLVSVSMIMTAPATTTRTGVTTPSTAFSLATVMVATVAFAGRKGKAIGAGVEVEEARLLRESASLRVKRIRSSSKRRIPFLDKRAAVMMTMTVPVVSIARTRKVIATLLSRGI